MTRSLIKDKENLIPINQWQQENLDDLPICLHFRFIEKQILGASNFTGLIRIGRLSRKGFDEFIKENALRNNLVLDENYLPEVQHCLWLEK